MMSTRSSAVAVIADRTA